MSAASPASGSPPFLANVLLFSRALRAAGLPVSLDQTMRFARALEWLDVGDRDQVYHGARALLVTRREDLRLFEALFHQFWSVPGEPASRGQKAPLAPRHDRPKGRPFTIATFMAYKARGFEKEVEIYDRAGSYSDQEVLASKDFSQMAPEELETVRRLMREMRFAVSRRTTRRRVADDAGRALDLRRTLRQSAKHGGVAIHLPRLARKVKERPMVLLADVSGSMEKYSRLLLQLFYSVGHSLKDVESFVFATRLSHVTHELRLRNIDQAVDHAARQVIDWSGGTRIGECLGTFNRRWSRRVLRRGAVVLIVSDGWDRGDTTALAAELRYLRHRCHRLIWLNPLSGREGYEPKVEGMAAALPYIDDFLPVHNLQSLDQLVEHLRSLPARRG